MSDTNTRDMDGIPPVLDTDAEDVVWALQTADALWKRNERIDAIVWLRRAAQAAGEAEDDDRALTLARGAAELAELLAHAPPAANSAAPPSTSSPPSSAAGDAIESLLRASQADIDVSEMNLGPGPVSSALSSDREPMSLSDAISIEATIAEPVVEVAPLAKGVTPDDSAALQVELVERVERIQRAPLAPSAPALRASSVASIPPAPPVDGGTSSRPPPPVQAPQSIAPASARSAAETHAGMLDPWAEPEARKVRQPSARPPPVADDEVVTSVRAPVAPIAPLPPPPSAPAPTISLANAPAQTAPPPLPPRPLAPKKPPQPKPKATPPPAPRAAPPAPVAAPRLPAVVESSPPPPVAAAPAAELPPVAAAAPKPPPEPARAAPVDAPPAPAAEAPPVATEATLDLTHVDAFGDLPDDARDAFARAAKIEAVTKDQEVASFALALVLDGEVDVTSPIVDAAVERLAKGAVLRSRGTLDEPMPVRLMCASAKATVAIWPAAAVEEAFRTCPWVEDDLCAAGDRVQALVGLTMGPLGERLDASLRAQVTTKLALRKLGPGEVFATQGGAIPGLLVVGAGDLELVKGEDAAGTLGPGEFLFANEFLSHSPAPATARAAKGGALVLVAGRMEAQELLVTCPPLLEIFSGG